MMAGKETPSRLAVVRRRDGVLAPDSVFSGSSHRHPLSQDRTSLQGDKARFFDKTSWDQDASQVLRGLYYAL